MTFTCNADSLLQSAANCLSDFYRGWSNLVVLNVVKQPCEGVEDESVIYTCQYRYVGEEKKLDPEGMLVEKCQFDFPSCVQTYLK